MRSTERGVHLPRHRVLLLLATLLIGGVLTSAVGFAADALFLDWRWQHVAVHSAVESFGSAVTMGIGVFLLVRWRRTSEAWRLWLACCFLVTAVLNCFHACLPPGREFVWLHSTAMLLGGALAAMVWLPDRLTRTRTAGILPAITVLGAAIIGIATLTYGEIVPEMVSGAEFSFTAVALNVTGGVGFLVGALYRTHGRRVAPCGPTENCHHGKKWKILPRPECWSMALLEHSVSSPGSLITGSSSTG